MLVNIFWAILLAVITAALHGVYSMSLVSRLYKRYTHPHVRHRNVFFHVPILSEIVFLLLLIHCVEAFIWALFYFLQHGLADMETALYFSLTSYTTIGYGDVLLPKDVRLVGVIEGLVGTFMCGWSVALLVAALQCVIQAGMHPGIQKTTDKEI